MRKILGVVIGCVLLTAMAGCDTSNLVGCLSDLAGADLSQISSDRIDQLVSNLDELFESLGDDPLGVGIILGPNTDQY